MGRKPHGQQPERKKNPLLELPADQTWNSQGSVVWSNKMVTCPRCGKKSRLTLAASLRSDWDLSLTCCPLPVTPRAAGRKPKEAVQQSIPSVLPQPVINVEDTQTESPEPTKSPHAVEHTVEQQPSETNPVSQSGEGQSASDQDSSDAA